MTPVDKLSTNLIKLVVALLLLILLSCQNKQSAPPAATQPALRPATQAPEKAPTYRFVSAANGLNFRDEPRGERLGTLVYNQTLQVVKETGLRDTITDEGKPRAGEWLGVLHQSDTIYVFSAFLTNTKDVSDLRAENELYVDPTEFVLGKVIRYLEGGQEEEVEANKLFEISIIDKREFETRYEAQRNFEIRSTIDKQNNALLIDCQNGDTLIITDQHIDNDEWAEIYSYVKTFPAINAHLIAMSGWEWGSYYLFDYTHCTQLELNGEPAFNPDYSQVLCVQHDLADEHLFLNDFTEENIQPRYRFRILQSPTRVILTAHGDFYIELFAMWHDGEMQKQSRQYFWFDWQE